MSDDPSEWIDNWVPNEPSIPMADRLRETAGGWDELYLFQRALPELPPEIRGFRHLRKLWIYNNRLTALPAWLAELPRLELIDAKSNRLAEVPFALLRRPALELRLAANPLDHDRIFRTLVEHYNAAESEDVARTCAPDATVHLPRVRPANGTGHDGIAKVLGDAYPRYGTVEVIEAGPDRAVIEPARAARIELRLTWRDSRLSRVDGGRCPTERRS